MPQLTTAITDSNCKNLGDDTDAIREGWNKSQKDWINVQLKRCCFLEVSHIKYHEQTVDSQ